MILVSKEFEYNEKLLYKVEKITTGFINEIFNFLINKIYKWNNINNHNCIYIFILNTA